jgi:hypothetical protein
MSSLRPIIGSLILAVTFGSVYAGETDPDAWYLTPYVQVVAGCAENEAVDHAKLRRSVETAGRTVSGFVPKNAWALVLDALVPVKRQPASPEVLATCSHIMESLAAPEFSTQFRERIAAQGVGVLALTCLVHYPATVPNMKADWIAAYQRQGFSIDAEALDKSVKDATPKDPKSSLNPHFPIKAETCKEVETSLFGPGFDAQYGEEGIRKLFGGR